MSELKPCPFCGGEAKMLIHHNEQLNYVRYSIECQRCLTESNKYFVPKIAEEAWNRRAVDGK